MIKFFQKEDAFTVLELIIASAIAAVISIAISFTLAGMSRSAQFSYDHSHNAMTAQNALGMISSLMKYADKDSLDLNPGASKHRVKFSASGELITIDIDNNTIVITQGSKQRKIAKNMVQALTFTRDTTDKRKVLVSLDVRTTQSKKSPTMKLSTTLMLINM